MWVSTVGSKFSDDNMPLCDNCEIDIFRTGNYFMVSDRLWAKIAGMYEMLCIPCSEERLGRPFKDKEIKIITLDGLVNR